MTKFANKKFTNSVKHAFDGIIATLKSQKNFKIQLFALILITILAITFKYSCVEFCICFFSIMLVLILEMINSALEFTLDSHFRNKYSLFVKLAKDIAAGAVLLSSFNCLLINIIIFVAKICF